EKFLRLVLGRRELAGRHRLEDQRRVSGRLEGALRVERDGCGREREEPLGCRLLELLAAEEDVAELGQDSVVSSAGCAAGSASAPGCAPAGPGAGSASPAAISFCDAPDPTSAF